MPYVVDAAQQFLAASGRVVDRRRLECAFRNGPADAVRDAVAAYRTTDGGFGHGLEPDGRCPGAQPPAIMLALRFLDEADAWDAELVGGALAWLEAHAPAEGGATFVEPTIAGWPAAPWWQPQDGLPASPVSTGSIVATLVRRGETHPWIDGASAFLRAAAAAGPSAPYDLLGLVAFANACAPELLDVLEAPVRAVVPDFNPLLFAPRPDAPAAAWFDLEPVVAALAGAQAGDGGWTFDWPAWSPAAAADWRGCITVDALLTLRAFGAL